LDASNFLTGKVSVFDGPSLILEDRVNKITGRIFPETKKAKKMLDIPS
jgi:hypothetical protein